MYKKLKHKCQRTGIYLCPSAENCPNIPAQARTAHNGLLPKRLEEDICWIVISDFSFKRCLIWAKSCTIPYKNSLKTVCTQILQYNFGCWICWTFLVQHSFTMAKLASWLASHVTSSFMHLTNQVGQTTWCIQFKATFRTHFVMEFITFSWCLSKADWFLWNFLSHLQKCTR